MIRSLCEPAQKQRVVIDPDPVDKSHLGKNLSCNREFVAQHEEADPDEAPSLARHFQSLAEAVARSRSEE